MLAWNLQLHPDGDICRIGNRICRHQFHEADAESVCDGVRVIPVLHGVDTVGGYPLELRHELIGFLGGESGCIGIFIHQLERRVGIRRWDG